MIGFATWSLRDVLRRPGEAALVAVALAALAAVLGTGLLLGAAMRHTARGWIDAGPSLVLRRLDAGGWAPIDASIALPAVGAVRGVTGARGRVWGVVGGPEGPVTVIGVGAEDAAAWGVEAPGVGEAIVGDGVRAAMESEDAPLVLQRIDGSMSPRSLTARFGLDAQHAPGLHRAVLVEPDLARELLLLRDGEVCDLAVDVRHQTEEAAIVPDLVAALPFAVGVETRTDARGRYATTAARRGSLGALAALPALLAVVVLVVGAARDRVGRRSEVALLKAMGWGTADVVRLHLLRGLWIGVPAIVLGSCVAWALVLWPGSGWPGVWFLGWTSNPPPLTLDPDGALLVVAEVAGLVGAPWLLAVLWPAFRAATHDPGELLTEDAQT